MSFFGKCVNCKTVSMRCLCQWSEIILNNFNTSEGNFVDINKKNDDIKTDDIKNDNNNETMSDYLFNHKYFWENITTKQINRNVIRLYNIRTIMLGTENQTIIHIGIDPFTKFAVRCEFECKNTNKSIACDSAGLKQIFEFANNFFKSDVYHPSTMYSTSIEDVDTKSKVSLEISRFYYRQFILKVGPTSLKVSENSLEHLLQMESMIQQIVIQLQEERQKLEKHFFDILRVYYEQNRNKFLSHICNPVTVQQFLDEMISNACNCAPKNFIISTAVYFKDWFISVCLPVYIETILLNEEERLKTFTKGNWYHKKLDTMLMAKTGLYLIAPFDKVKCVFCGVEIEKWNITDHPVKDHYKYSNYCPLLNNQPTQNRSEHDENLHQYLKFIVDDKPNGGYDEVDCKKNMNK